MSINSLKDIYKDMTKNEADLDENKKTTVFVDSQNLFKTFESLGIQLDMAKLFEYFRSNLKVSSVCMFLGYLKEKEHFYLELENIGYKLFFRPVVRNADGVKANVDCDVVLSLISDIESYDKAILVSNDGDYYNTIKYLKSKNKFANVISPSRATCSKLLKRICDNKIIFADDIFKYITQNPPESPKDLEELPTPLG